MNVNGIEYVKTERTLELSKSPSGIYDLDGGAVGGKLQLYPSGLGWSGDIKDENNRWGQPHDIAAKLQQHQLREYQKAKAFVAAYEAQQAALEAALEK